MVRGGIHQSFESVGYCGAVLVIACFSCQFCLLRTLMACSNVNTAVSNEHLTCLKQLWEEQKGERI